MVWIFVYIYTLCTQAVKALASMYICVGLPESLPLDNKIYVPKSYVLAHHLYFNIFTFKLQCLFDLVLYVPVNNFSVTSGRVFLGWTSTQLGLMWLAQGHNQWCAEAWTHNPSVLSQALYHGDTALPQRTVQSLYNTPCYITDLDISQSCCSSQNLFLPWNFTKEL